MNPFRHPTRKPRRAYIVQGLAFGDEGKGSIVDYLCRAHDAPLVVRFNGGPQSARNVVQPDGSHHTFHQFGSGMFISEACTFLSKYVFVDPFSLMKEAEALERKGIRYTQERLFIDPECLIVTPYHQYANRIRELIRGVNRHGSGGHGAGETRRDALLWGTYIQVKDILCDAPALGMLEDIRAHKMKQLREYWGMNADADKLLTELSSEDPRRIAEFYRLFAQGIQPATWAEVAQSFRDANVVFEGTAGTLLDETHGFAPYVTPSNTTFDNALELCDEAGLSPVRIGVLRTHFTRHGPGPFVSEDRGLSFPDHNVRTKWQGDLRFGHFDFVAARYAIKCCGRIDGLALTHMDCVESPFTYVDEYRDSHGFTSSVLKPDAQALSETKPAGLKLQVVEDDAALVRFIEQRLDCKVLYRSSGPTYQDKAILRPEIVPALATQAAVGETPFTLPKQAAG
ncbi:MAG: adenylosuccinate synthetase [Bryobacteraceae bacterium]|jgi:adenylosuccinate synthase